MKKKEQKKEGNVKKIVRIISIIALILGIILLISGLIANACSRTTTIDNKEEKDPTEQFSQPEQGQVAQPKTEMQKKYPVSNMYVVTKEGIPIDLPQNFFLNPSEKVKVVPPDNSEPYILGPNNPLPDRHLPPGTYWFYSDTTFDVALEVRTKN